ncbi:MAG: acyltransferase [Chloroflexi bacterium]|nr:acyltransferase [Chloroflexota bacterium]
MTRIAAIQINVNGDQEVNLRKVSDMVRRAACGGARIMCLPELFNLAYFCHEEDARHFRLAEPVPGPTVERMAGLARETESVIICPIFEKAMEGEYYNTAVVVGPEGQIIGRYRKNSIPYNPKPNEPLAREKFYFKPGNLGFPVFATPFGLKVGVLICYDRHFPEAPRALALNGADVIFVPICVHAARGRSVWEFDLRAIAQANILYLCGVNRVGVDVGGSTRNHFGTSMIVNPRTEVIARASDDKEEVISADVDVELIAELRNAWSFFRDRRPDAYGDLVR